MFFLGEFHSNQLHNIVLHSFSHGISFKLSVQRSSVSLYMSVFLFLFFAVVRATKIDEEMTKIHRFLRRTSTNLMDNGSPTSQPSEQPSRQPTRQPTRQPSNQVHHKQRYQLSHPLKLIRLFFFTPTHSSTLSLWPQP